MSKEHEGAGIPITAIHINLKDRSITLEAEGQTVAKLTLSPEGVIFDSHPNQENHKESSQETPAPLPDSPLRSEASRQSADRPNSKERKTTVLTGRLKSKPKEGKSDRNGNPTATARFSAHVEGEDKLHDYYMSFHRHTTKLALTLDEGAQITVDGYPHKKPSPKLLDTFSVFNLINYPGKPRPNAKNSTDNQPLATTSSIWSKTLEKLKSETQGPVFDTWVKDTKYLGMDGDTAFIQVPTPFAKEWLERRLYQLMVATLQEITGKDTVVIHFLTPS